MKTPDLKILENFVPNSIELFREYRDSVVWDERMKARKTASFGVAYNYSEIDYPETLMLESLTPICERILEKVGFLPNNCLMNYYPDGSSTMGFHSDSVESLYPETGVVIISLGAERHISYRSKINREIKVKYKLASGLLLFMSNEVQDNWQHAIPKEKDAGERISLTFRKMIENA